MSIATRSIAVSILALVAVTGARAADVSGTWNAEFDTQIGKQKYTFTLRQDGTTVTGKANSEIAGQKRQVELQDGKIDGDTITFFEIFTFQDVDIRIDYKGTVEGDGIKFTRKVGDFATEEFVAKRGEALVVAAAPDVPSTRPRGDERRRRRPRIELGPDDKPQFPPAPAGFDRRREGIARGKIDVVEYDSKTVGIKRKMVVYTPPGYSKDKKYPVLYLLHGLGGNEFGWVRMQSADVILDNLCADKKIVPMIVVMPNGRASAEPPPANPFDGNPFETYAAFEDDLLKDVILHVESQYSARADREHRALAGLSMGGGQSLNFGLKQLDTFAWVGGFSSAPNTKPAKELIGDPAVATRKLRLLWVSCGNRDGLIRISQSFHRDLVEMKVPHLWHVDSGGHTFRVWKNDLYLFSQLLFRDPGDVAARLEAARQYAASQPAPEPPAQGPGEDARPGPQRRP